MIAVVVSTANDCEYCVVHHSAALRRHVMDDELVKHLAKDFEGARLEAKDKDMLQYAVKLTMRPASISQHDLERLKKDALPTRRFSISLS